MCIRDRYLDWTRSTLNERIVARAKDMISNGWFDEAKLLFDKQDKSKVKFPALNSIGYSQIMKFLKDEINKSQLEESIIIETRQFAKKQAQWFAKEKIDIVLEMDNLKIKDIPKVSWSSDKPLNLKPKFLTSFFLCLGLIIFGLGEGLLIVSASGASPWSVLAQGLFLNIGFSVGLITIFISIAVLFLWFPLKQKPGIGTILNALIIGLIIDVCIKHVPTP